MGERVEPRAKDAKISTGVVQSIGIIGGTGALGRGLAHRLSISGWPVVIGSRDAARARECAAELGHTIDGVVNADACASDLVIIAVPWLVHASTVSGLAPHLGGRLVVDAVNPLAFDDRGPHAIQVAAGSAAEEAQQLLPTSTVVGAFHHMSADLLLSTGSLDTDVLVAGDDRDAISCVTELVDSVEGLRGVYAGRLRNCGQLEALAANLIAINRRYRTQAGLRVTGLSN